MIGVILSPRTEMEYCISYEKDADRGYVRFNPDTERYYVGSGDTELGDCIFTLEQATMFNKHILGGKGRLEVVNPTQPDIVISRKQFLNAHHHAYKMDNTPPQDNTKLREAIEAGDINAVTTLIHETGNPSSNAAAFIYTVDMDYIDMARIILPLCEVNHSSSKTTLLGLIIHRKHDEGLIMLLDAKADPNQPYKDVAPLHEAIRNNYDFGVSELLKRGADAITCAGEMFGTCLQRHDYRTCQLLLQYKADVDARHIRQVTPLMFALEIESTIGVKFLLDAKANPDLVAEDLNTPVYVMAMRKDIAMVELLLTYKAGVNVICADGRTALHAAVRTDDVGLVSLLLNAKADLSIADIDGITPVMLARSRNCASIIRLLRPKHACEVCQNNDQTYPCSRCKRVCYCSRICQKADWVKHKVQCQVDEVTPVPDSSVLKLKQDRDNEVTQRRRDRSSVLVRAIEDYLAQRIDSHQLRGFVGQGYELDGDDRTSKYQSVLESILITSKKVPKSKPSPPVIQPQRKPTKKKASRPNKPSTAPKPVVQMPSPVPPLPPLAPMSPSERLDWHGRVITEVEPTSLPKPSELPNEANEPHYSLLIESDTFGSLMLDYTHVFKGEWHNDELHGFHHDYHHRSLGLSNAANPFSNGCYIHEHVTSTGTMHLTLFPAIWHPNDLLLRLKLALTGMSYTVYTDPDTCAIGELPKLSGDRDCIALHPIYFKAVIKRDVPGVIRTLYPLTAEQYNAAVQKSQV